MLKMDRRVHVVPAQRGERPAEHRFRRWIHEGDAASGVERVDAFTKVVGDGAQKVKQALVSILSRGRLLSYLFGHI
jgi:hypothetical protein